MGKLVALNTNNEEKKLKTEQAPATTVSQGQRGRLVQTGSASAPVSSPSTVYRTSPVKTTPVAQQKNGLQSGNASNRKETSLGKATFSGSRTPGKQQKYSVGKGIAGATMKGINQAAQGIADTLALAEDVALSPFELISGQQLGDLSDSGLANKLQRRIRNEGQEIENKYAANIERGGAYIGSQPRGDVDDACENCGDGNGPEHCKHDPQQCPCNGERPAVLAFVLASCRFQLRAGA